MGILLNRERLYWLLQCCGWGLLAVGTFVLANIFDLEYPRSLLLRRVVVLVITGALVSHWLRMAIKRTSLLQQTIERSLGWLLLALLMASLVQGLLVIACFDLFELFLDAEVVEKLSFVQLLIAVSTDVGIFMLAWLTIYCFYHYYSDSRQRQLDTLQLESMVKQMELKTLKAHLNPHFIFNSLNSIRALVDINPERARRAITELSNLLRGSLQTEQAQLVPLEKEIEIIRDYLALEQIRFEDRMQVDWQIAQETLLLPVPPMMLQTLVENAIKHGIGTLPQGGHIQLRSRIEDRTHVMEIVNSGRLSGPVINTGFGIGSTQNRLQLLYGPKASFSITSVAVDQVQVTVKIPI